MQAIFALHLFKGFSFYLELLFLARKLGFTVRQVPIAWQHVEGSSFKPGAAVALREVRDLLRIRWLHRGVRPNG